MSIRPLPDEVVAQIKSSTAVVSLNGVVLELVKNSLDAKASRIEATVDFSRGGCIVEDDGLGIPPAEFSEDGGLGKRHWTSKFHSEEPHFGQQGTFLASLSATSLLTITSHHHAYRSQNSISFHHVQRIERQIPTPAHNHVQGKHGTRVTVRNLFGNMPVRVKQRAMIVDQKTEQARLRNSLKRDAVSLLLSWQGQVSLRIRDGDGNTIVHINTSNMAVRESNRYAVTGKPRPAHLSSLLQIMTQASWITIDEWASWVPISASTPGISVKGAISLDPAPTKHMQFVSFGLRPLFSGGGGNELYDQVNRLFALSSFGTIEDDADADEREKRRRLSDRRYKNDGYTNRQLKARKGVDRFPMFHLRVSLKDMAASDAFDDHFFEDESNLQAVVDVISAMIVQWLSVHHFCPRKLYHSSGRSQAASTASQDPAEQSSMLFRKRQAPLGNSTRASIPDSTSPTKFDQNHKLTGASFGRLSERPRSQAFADWSRIKSGKSSFFKATGVQITGAMDVRENSLFRQFSERGSQPIGNNNQQEIAAFDVAPRSNGTWSNTAITTPPELGHSILSMSDDKDGTVIWTEPSTKRTYHLNARTGCMMPAQRPQTDPATLSRPNSRPDTSSSLRMPPKSASAGKTLWLDGLLQNWENPIFKASEGGIQQVSLQSYEEQENRRHAHHSHMGCSNFDMQKAFNDAGSISTKLSKAALRHAEVVSQVDNKFILAKMTGSSAAPGAHADPAMMVLIDQHAADERVRVESLLHELCRPVRDDEIAGSQSGPVTALVAQIILDKPLHFTTSLHELTHFKTFRANFAAWSILYDIDESESIGNGPGETEQSPYKLSVTALPPSISERCIANPELLISFLRSAVWKYVESPPLPPAEFNDPHTSWVKKIATCPAGLVDMINSRACRSAIMFNDELSLEECKLLVGSLAQCVFPFMCAHGRPSMVPIIDMARVGSSDSAANDHRRSFVDAWTSWKRP